MTKQIILESQLDELVSKIETQNATIEEKLNVQNLLLANIAYNNGALVLDSPKAVQRFLRAGLLKGVLHPSDQIIIDKVSSVTATKSGSGITAVTVDANTFLSKVGYSDDDVHLFTFSSTNNAWMFHGEAVLLSNYGITVTGTPSNGDTVTVTVDSTQYVMDVLGIDQDTPADPNLTHTLALQMHNCLMDLQFDASEALMYFPEGLEAGTYNITLDHGAYGGGTGQDGTYSFTITQDIPAGGFLKHSTMGCYQSSYNPDQIVAGKFSTHNADYSALESNLTTGAGAVGTSLGTVTARDPQYRQAGALAAENINATERQYYGNNNYAQSALKQMLESDADAGSVWSSKHKFDFPPSWKSSQAGFLKGIDPALREVIGKVVKRTGLHLWDRTILGVNYVDTEELVWLPSFSEVYFGKNTYGSQVDEGGPYDFYKDYSDLSAPGTGADTNRIKRIGATAKYWWLRSPYPSSAYDVYGVGPSGAYGINGAYYANGLAPAFCIV